MKLFKTLTVAEKAEIKKWCYEKSWLYIGREDVKRRIKEGVDEEMPPEEHFQEALKKAEEIFQWLIS